MLQVTDCRYTQGQLPVRLPVSFVRLVFFLESSSAPDCISGVRISNSRDPSQDISILSSFTFRIHSIRGVFINVRPFSTITLVEPLRSDCSGSQHRRDAGGLFGLVPIGSDQLGGFRRWQLRQLNS